MPIRKKISNQTVSIKFPFEINSVSFEHVLKSKYHSTKLNACQVIKFDLSLISWIGIFELSILSLWLKELLEKKKIIHVVLPVDINAKKFLFRYDFFKFLQEHQIETNLEMQNKVNTIDLVSTPYFPLKFYSETDFDNFIKYISDEKNYNEIFSDLAETIIGRSQFLRNTIVRELGDNMYQHAKGRFSNIIMSKFGRSSKDKEVREKWKNSLVRNSIGNEKKFFEDLYGRDYITLVISDKGPGIFKTLFETGWKNDENINQTKSPDECEVIRYALLEHTTSKTKEERFGQLSELFDNSLFENDPPALPGPTGLFQVFNTVRQNHGFMMIRSGSSIVSYNFYGITEEPSVFESNKVKTFKNLANFSGTQIKIHLPLDLNHPRNLEIRNKIYFSQPKFLFPESDIISDYHFFSLSDYKVGVNLSAAQQKTEIIKFYDQVDKIKKDLKGKSSGIIFDLCNQKGTSFKVLNFFIAKLMDSQSNNFSHVLINLNKQSASLLKAAFNNIEKHKPIILFDTNFRRHVIGIPIHENNAFQKLFTKSVFDEEDLRLIKKYPHIFFESNNENALKHNRTYVFEYAANKIRKYLEKEIKESSNGIFNSSVKVVMPNGIFCEGYFEISKCIEQENLKSRLKQWITSLMVTIKPNYIISVGKSCNHILDDIFLESWQSGHKIKAQHFKIRTPLKIDFKELYSLESQIGSTSNVIVFTDVVGTTLSIKNVLRSLNKVNDLKLISIVNASNETNGSIKVGNKLIPFLAILNHKINFYEKRPESWTEDNLSRVDELSNNLIRKKSSILKPIWKEEGLGNDFVNNLIIKNKNYLFGHFIHDNTHLPVLFHIPGICSSHSGIISDVILQHFNNDLEARGQDFNAKDWTICYLNDKVEINKIASIISKKTYIKIEQINNKEIYHSNDFEGDEFLNKKILFIDDALDTGENLFRLIDFCSRHKAIELSIYILIKRGSDYAVRKLSNIKSYSNLSNISFNYLSELKIPTYSEIKCPICFKLSELKLFKEKIKADEKLKKLYLKTDELETSLIGKPINSIESERMQNTEQIDGALADDLSIRLLIETAKENIESFEKIYLYINSYKEHYPTVLKILCQISRENLFFIFNLNYGIESSKREFKNKIIAILVDYLKSPLVLPEPQFDALLVLLRKLDEARFVERIMSLLKKVFRNEKLFYLLLINICLFKETSIHYNNIFTTIKKFIQEANHNLNSDFKNILNGVLKWMESEKHIRLDKNHYLNNYVELRQIFHTLNQNINTLKSFLSLLGTSNNESEKSIFEFETFLNSLDKLTSNLHIFIEFDFYDQSIIHRANKLIIKVQNIRDKISFQYDHWRANGMTNVNISDIQSSIDEINELLATRRNSEGDIQDNVNLNEILKSSTTNIKELINYIQSQVEIKFSNTIIEYKKLNIEESIIVFGDTNGIAAIIENLIENIYQHSGAKKFECRVHYNNSGKEVEIIFLDDGKLPEKVKPDEGINTIRKNIERYSHKEFELRKVHSSDHGISNSYKTIAKFYLSYLQK